MLLPSVSPTIPPLARSGRAHPNVIVNMKKKATKNKNKADIRGFWSRLWELLTPLQKRMKILLGFILVVEAFNLVGPYFLKLIIDNLTNFSVDKILPIVYLAVLMFLSEQFTSLLNYYKDKIVFKLLVKTEYYLPVEAEKKLVYLSLSYHEKENTGNKIIKIERGLQKITDLMANMSWEVVPTLVQLVMTLIVLIIVDWRLGLSFIFFAPLFIFITYKVNKGLSPLRKQRHKNYETASGKMGQSIININTVKSFVQEKREVKEYSLIKNIIKINEIKEHFRMLRFGLGRNLVIDLGRISILLLGVYFIWQNNMSIGTLVFVITLSEKAYFSLWRLSRFYDRVEEGAEAVNRFVKLLNEEVDIKNPKNGFKPDGMVGQIEFKKVNFRYEKDSGLALKNINLNINSGCVTALVGPSGGGKTTVARMIYRHYDPQSGRVLLDGKDLKAYDLYGFRKFIAIVPQEVEIFDTSVRGNISYARSGANFQEIKAAARIANAEEFIDKLSKKYNTLVGERGIKLSGGQRQRIGIARAILANPKILIFDEATSNLDSYSEKLIQGAIEKIRKGRTIIIIAHRLSTIKRADKIIVLEEGQVVDQGSHYELAQAGGGLYAKLLKLQKMGDVE